MIEMIKTITKTTKTWLHKCFKMNMKLVLRIIISSRIINKKITITKYELNLNIVSLNCLS